MRDAAKVLLTDSQPRYAALAAALARAITEGQYAVGALLPTEGELVSQYGLSRPTVREALRRLREIGLVTAEHGIGTRVTSRAPRANYEMAVRSLAELMRYDGPTRLEVQQRRRTRLDARLAADLGLEEGLPVLGVSGLRLRGSGEPLSIVRMFVPEPFAESVDHANPEGKPLHRLVGEAHGLRLGELRQQISAVKLSTREAAELRLPPRSPGLRILRAFHAEDGRLMEATVNLHPSRERFTYDIRLTAT
jgi:DNA-binding GntR family transcriptional regulator